MTECYQNAIALPSVKRRKITYTFEGGDVTSEGGSQVLRLADRSLKLTTRLARMLGDSRVQGRCQHSLRTLIRQRLYALALGYEDLNDHGELRHDPAFQAAVEEHTALASASTLCRLEQRATAKTAWAMHELLFEAFVSRFDRPPKRLILDFDATNNPIHGMQVGRHFNAFYDEYCFLPLYVFCGSQLLVSYLRPVSWGAADHAAPVLRLLVMRLRAVWPDVQIVFRGDAGFCTPLLLAWCDRHGVDYAVGIGSNSRLRQESSVLTTSVEALYRLTGKKQRQFAEFNYAAGTWRHQRRVIVKAEYNALGANTRFIITSLPHDARWLYTKFYCARGDMENRIKEQMQLFSGRTSCHQWWPNQFRLLLSGFAYVLVETIRHVALTGTALARAEVNTIRLRLFKIGAVVLRNTRRVQLMLSSRYPHQSLFAAAVRRLDSG